ncbi:bifunctional DNA primase/polymerase [Methylobacterium sp. WSM2598]|uniref:bifunctional DNA primase/polymerase n=1 Tax=Methylobacterium sp. WSM2598 TaxID=398261 RepID=UPI00039C98C1|nr:bifunctional DNA primase/polymerase [Methylobacterium sp. WSM2598]
MASVPGAYGQVGARLVERGYAAIPIIPGTKRPGLPLADGSWIGMDDWQARFRHRLPVDVEIDRWSDSDAGVGIALGPPSGGVVSADIDTDDPEIRAAILGVLPATTVGKAGQKGETLFYRGSAKFPSRAFNVPGPGGKPVRVLDLLGQGKQTVLPPTVHPDTGEPYRWTRLQSLDSVAPDDLPWIDDDVAERIAEALRPFGYQAEPERPPRREVSAGEEAPHRALNNRAMADLGAWVPQLGLYKLRRMLGGYRAVATWRPSHRGRPLEQRSTNLKIHPEGIRDFHDGDRAYTPLDLVMAARGLALDEAFEWLGRHVGFGEGLTIDLQPRRVELREGVVIDAETGEVLEAPASGDTRDFPDEDLQVPGLVGEIADWIMASSPKPIRLFAVAAALVTVGTLIGRRVYCGTPRSGAHLYVMTIAGTGAGKERPQEAVRQILDAVSSHRMHTAAASSASSLAMRLAERPVQVQIVDEVDKILRRVGHRMANAQEAEMLQDYCTLWGRGMGTFIPNSTTTRGDILIQRPCLSLYGATTFTSFYEQMRSKLVSNGFLNRFLVLPRFERVGVQAKVAPEEVVPEGIVAAAKRLFEFQDAPPPGGDPRRHLGATATLMDPARPPPLVVVEMSAEAQAIYDECRARDENMLCRADEDPLYEAWSRGAELTKRVALVVACGRFAEAGLEGVIVEEGDMAFARRLVDWSFSLFVTGLRENMAENEHQAGMKAVLAFIRAAGQPVTRSDVYRRVDGRMDARQLDGVMRYLLTSGQIEELVEKTKGRPKTFYRTAD